MYVCWEAWKNASLGFESIPLLNYDYLLSLKCLKAQPRCAEDSADTE